VTGTTASVSALSAPGTVTGAATATCAAGKVLLGGGALITGTGTAVAAIYSSYPSSTTVWTAQAVVTSSGLSGTVTVQAYALCSQ
jgi:hypothetical protein